MTTNDTTTIDCTDLSTDATATSCHEPRPQADLTEPVDLPTAEELAKVMYRAIYGPPILTDLFAAASGDARRRYMSRGAIWHVDPRTIPAEPEDPRLERVAQALYEARTRQHPARLAGRHRQDPRQAPEARPCGRRCDRRGGEVR